MPALASIAYGQETITRDDATARILASLLTRLAPALWNTAPEDPTVQRDLAQALAEQLALWLENKTIAQQMTLLLQAEGLDLDALLQDYGLRRYLQRPDEVARQVGMHCLWMPQGTEHALSVLADLLFDLPHQVVRTGRHEAHVFVTDTHPVTTPSSYWGMIARDTGVWYAVTIHQGVPAISPIAPPGLNTAPGPQTPSWFMVLDETQAPWYVTIDGDTLMVSDTQPTWGFGTTEPFRVLDGAQLWWELRVDRHSQVLNAVALTGSAPYAYWRVQSPDRGLYYVYMDNFVPTINPVAPAGRDETPTTANLDWFTVWDETQTPWYVTIQGDTLQLSRVQPTGNGTAVPFRVVDRQGNVIGLFVNSAMAVLESRVLQAAATEFTVTSPSHPFEAVHFIDSQLTSWWLSMHGGTAQLTPTLPVGATDVTPPGGPFAWLRVYGLGGERWYGYANPSGVWAISLTSPGGLGTAVPQTLGDDRGVQWHFGVSAAKTFAISNTPRTDLQGLSTAMVLNDATGTRWFWRIAGNLSLFEVAPVLWPDAISQVPWGELGWLQIPTEAGETRFVFPDVGTGVPIVSIAPPLTSWWGWTEPVVLYDRTGQAWTLSVGYDGTVVYTPQGAEDIPQRPPLLSLRDATDAFGHIQSAGSLVTTLIS